jgi:mannose-6-phosphate isomerase-like protein (cupin superfamily)
MMTHSRTDDGPGEHLGARRVVVGLDGDGRSTVLRDAPTSARTVRPNGAVVEEIWRQEHLPARINDDGTRVGEMEAMPPTNGATVRMFTLPPDTSQGNSIEGAVAGALELNLRRSSEPPTLLRTDSMYVATVVSGEAYVVLEAGEVLLTPGDSLILPGCMHAWRNETGSPTVIVTAVFPLEGETNR